ncbi:MAG TPA: metal-dependent hydrolase [Planctomycetota bacterium]|nr:metal-dependent hydrolase [Planctomycetota bacterium]
MALDFGGMDNLTHTFFGWICARAGLERQGRWVLPTLLVSANLPDADIVVSPLYGGAAYLQHHRGITHSFVGIVAQAVLVSAAVLLCVRMFNKAPQTPRLLHVFAIALLGLCSHLLLDFLNSYGVRPWLPFDTRWYYGDMAFIVDPWMWLIFGGTLYVSTADRVRVIPWLLLTLGTTAVVFLAGARLAHWLVPFLWSLGLVLVIVLRLKERGAVPADRSARLARGGLAVFGLYVLMLFALSRSAEARVVALTAGTQPQTDVIFSTHPLPGVPWRFRVIAERQAQIDFFEVDVLRATVQQRKPYFPSLKDLALARACNTAACCAWRSFARHPTAERAGDQMILGDARYRYNPGGDWSAQRVPLPPEPGR